MPGSNFQCSCTCCSQRDVEVRSAVSDVFSNLACLVMQPVAANRPGISRRRLSQAGLLSPAPYLFPHPQDVPGCCPSSSSCRCNPGMLLIIQSNIQTGKLDFTLVVQNKVSLTQVMSELISWLSEELRPIFGSSSCFHACTTLQVCIDVTFCMAFCVHPICAVASDKR